MRSALKFLAITAFVSAAGIAHAAGGLYLDDISFTNKGVSVLSTGFEDGKLTGWSPAINATVVSTGSTPIQHTLYLSSRPAKPGSSVYAPGMLGRSVSIDKPGMVELSFSVYICPSEEQNQWDVRNMRHFVMISLIPERIDGQRSEPVATFGLFLQQGAHMCDGRLSNAVDKRGAVAKNIGVVTGKWAKLLFRMNPENSLMTLSVDGREVLRLPYDPAQIANIKTLNISSSLGGNPAGS